MCEGGEEAKEGRESSCVLQLWGGRGHTLRQCPSEASFCGIKGTRKSDKYHGRRPEVRQTFCCKGFVEGQFVNDIVLDTGCSRTLVRSDLVKKNRLNVEKSVVYMEISWSIQWLG